MTDCLHLSSTGVDTTDLRDPMKVWACDACGWRHRNVVDAEGFTTWEAVDG